MVTRQRGPTLVAAGVPAAPTLVVARSLPGAGNVVGTRALPFDSGVAGETPDGPREIPGPSFCKVKLCAREYS